MRVEPLVSLAAEDFLLDGAEPNQVGMKLLNIELALHTGITWIRGL